MEIEFAIQDAFAVVNPELKLTASLQEAGDALSEAVQLNYQQNSNEKIADLDDADDDHISDDVPEDDQDDGDDNADDDAKSSQEASEVCCAMHIRKYSGMLTEVRMRMRRAILILSKRKIRTNLNDSKRNVIRNWMLILIEI
jgi:hypothetical protein